MIQTASYNWRHVSGTGGTGIATLGVRLHLRDNSLYTLWFHWSWWHFSLKRNRSSIPQITHTGCTTVLKSVNKRNNSNEWVDSNTCWVYRRVLMTQSMGIVGPRLMHPMMQISLSLDQTPRRQLEDMARRGQRFCSLPPVPELSTPSESSMVESARTESSLNAPTVTTTEPTPPPRPADNPMTTSRLFQEFSNRQLREQGSLLCFFPHRQLKNGSCSRHVLSSFFPLPCSLQPTSRPQPDLAELTYRI